MRKLFFLFIFLTSCLIGKSLDEKALVSAIEAQLASSPLILIPSIHGGDNKVFLLQKGEEIIGVAKCYTKRNSEQVKAIYHISQRLADVLPIPLIRSLFLFEGSIPVMIQDFVPGEHIKKLNPAQLESVVSQMAKIHRTELPHQSFKESEFDYEELFKSLELFYDLDEIKKIYSSIDLSYLDKIPRSVIHGDISPSNLLFVKNGIVGILDLDHVRFSYRLIDIVRAQIFFSFNEEGEVNEKEILEFIKRYHFHNPLTHEETANFYHLMKLLLIKMALETYYYVEVRKEVPAEIFKKPSFNQSWEDLLKKLYAIKDKSSLNID